MEIKQNITNTIDRHGFEYESLNWMNPINYFFVTIALEMYIYLVLDEIPGVSQAFCRVFRNQIDRIRQ